MQADSEAFVQSTLMGPGFEPAVPLKWSEYFATVPTGRLIIIIAPLRLLAFQDEQKEKNKGSHFLKQTTYYVLRYN